VHSAKISCAVNTNELFCEKEHRWKKTTMTVDNSVYVGWYHGEKREELGCFSLFFFLLLQKVNKDFEVNKKSRKH